MDELIALLRAYVESGGTLPEGTVENAERLARAQIEAPAEGEDATPESALLVWAEGDEPMTVEELNALSDALTALGADESADIDLILSAADAVQVITTETEAREAVAEHAQAEREAAVARLQGARPQNAEDDPDSDDENAEDDPDSDGGGEDPEAETEGDPGDSAGDDETGAGDGAGTEDREPAVVAGGRPAGRRVSRDALLRDSRSREARRAASGRQRRPGSEPEQVIEDRRSPIVFAHGVPGTVPGAETRNLADVDRALERRRGTFRRAGSAMGLRPAKGAPVGDAELAGDVEAIPVATIQAQYPEHRRLLDADGNMLSSGEITRRIRDEIDKGIEETRSASRAAGQPGSLVAAGGLCVLPTPLYNIETLGITTRPIRDQALVSFQASRGGVTDLSPPTLPDLSGAVSQWTVANDESATGGSPTKPCLRVECGDPRTTQIYAVPVCLTIGNFLSRTYGELQQAWSRLALVAQARFAEALLFARLQALSTTVTNLATDWSASRDVLAILDQAATGMRSRHRLEDDFPFVVILPTNLLTVLRLDISRQMPVGNLRETMALANSEIAAWFAARSITPIWSPDVNVIGAQGATALAALPPTINWVMYPAGTFIHLDGGDLDLGVMRDTTTTAVNDFKVFSESFENVHMVGPESLAGTIDVCPSGAVSGTIDPAPWCASYT